MQSVLFLLLLFLLKIFVYNSLDIDLPLVKIAKPIFEERKHLNLISIHFYSSTQKLVSEWKQNMLDNGDKSRQDQSLLFNTSTTAIDKDSIHTFFDFLYAHKTPNLNGTYVYKKFLKDEIMKPVKDNREVKQTLCTPYRQPTLRTNCLGSLFFVRQLFSWLLVQSRASYI